MQEGLRFERTRGQGIRGVGKGGEKDMLVSMGNMGNWWSIFLCLEQAVTVELDVDW